MSKNYCKTCTEPLKPDRTTGAFCDFLCASSFKAKGKAKKIARCKSCRAKLTVSYQSYMIGGDHFCTDICAKAERDKQIRDNDRRDTVAAFDELAEA